MNVTNPIGQQTPEEGQRAQWSKSDNKKMRSSDFK